MSFEQENKGPTSQWESVHKCPGCGHIINLADIDLRAMATGVIACPECGWSGPVIIEISGEENP